jgi:type II secretory pathway pseudopilin PulG
MNLLPKMPKFFDLLRDFKSWVSLGVESLVLKKNKGASMVEVVGAVVVLSFSMALGVSLLTTTVKQAGKNQDYLTATYLAQECLELVRNVRDSAWKQHLPWDCAFSIGIFDIQSSSNLGTDLGAPNCQQDLGVKIEIFSDQKIEFSGELTKFARVLEITESIPSSEDELYFTCEVRWEDGVLRVSEALTNWRKN